jgi:hypothetical protein
MIPLGNVRVAYRTMGIQIGRIEYISFQLQKIYQETARLYPTDLCDTSLRIHHWLRKT